MAHYNLWWHLLPVIVSIYIVSMHVEGATESELLLKFKGSLGNDGALNNWNGSNPCPKQGEKGDKWTGVICHDGSVLGLQLENMSLTGLLDFDTLMGLSDLRTLSFMNNSFDGPMPQVNKLGALRSVYLSVNQFSGEIPDDAFANMGSLRRVYLSRNGFSGRIPSSLVTAPKLVEALLDGNHFSGEIPDFRQPGLQLDVSNNELVGPIPIGLSNMSPRSFSGNKGLCGAPLEKCQPSSQPSSNSSSKKKISTVVLIVLIVIGSVVALSIIGAAFILLCRRPKRSELNEFPPVNQKKTATYNRDYTERALPEFAIVEDEKAGREAEQGKLVFVREDRERFELHDLLRASAEVLGSGSFGSSYKAVLLSGPAMVVKRFKEMNGVGREEFQEHMRRLGRLRNPNLLPLVAFYYRKEEKLLVTDYVTNGSLVQLLHGNRNPNRQALNWPERLKIVKGVAKGLEYLYNEFPNQTLPHGHLKSSNVLLDGSFSPLLADYALAPVMNREHATQQMVAYKSPEYMQYGRESKKSDVWSLGILILEILTGKLPASHFRRGKGGGDLATWVNSVVREEWTGEVFDSGMQETRNGEGEMLKLLQIGLGCCERDVEKRWDLREAVERIEELKERGTDEDSFASEGDLSSSRGGVTEDDFSFSMNL